MNQLVNPGVISELLAEAGIVKPKQNRKSYVLPCPRCLKKDKLYIRKRDGAFCCWVCKERDSFQGAPEYALAEITGRSVTELKEILYGSDPSLSSSPILTLEFDFADFGEDEEETRYIPTVEVSPDFRDLDNKWSAPGIKYLESRGIPLEIAKEYGIMYWPARSRIVFPIVSSGRLLGWQSRTILPHEYIDDDGDIVKIPKSLTYEGLPKESVLGFADRITGRHAIITEGPVDAIKAHLCGGNIFTMGKAVSPTQLNLLRNAGITKLYLGLDPDAAHETWLLTQKMSDLELYDMRPPTGDLGAMTFEQVHQLFLNAPRINSAHLFLYLS